MMRITFIAFYMFLLNSAGTIGICNGTNLVQRTRFQSILHGIEGTLNGLECDVLLTTGPQKYYVERPTITVDAKLLWIFATRWNISSICRIMIHDGKSLSSIGVKGRPSGVTYHFIYAQKITDLNIRNIRLFGDVLITTAEKTVDSPRFYSPSPSGGTFLPLDLPHYPTKKDFNGEKLIWVTNIQRYGSFRLLPKYRESRDWLDPRLSMPTLITKALNATPAILEFQEYMGVDPETGYVTGMIGALQYGEAHISFFHMSQDLLGEIIHGAYIYTDGIIFISRLPLQNGQFNVLQSIYSLFDVNGWVITGAVMISITIVIRVSHEFIRKNEQTKEWVFVRTFAQLLKPIGAQPFSEELWRLSTPLSVRIVVSLWLLTSILYNSAIQTELISSLTSPSYDNPPRTFQELSSSDYKITVIMSPNSVLGKLILRNSSDTRHGMESGMFATIRKKIERVSLLTDEVVYEETQLRKMVGLGQLAWTQHRCPTHLMDRYGKKLFRVSDLIFSTYMVLGYNKGFPHIVDKANSVMLGQWEFGLFQHILESTADKSTRIGRNNGVARFKNETLYPSEMPSGDASWNTTFSSQAIACIIAGIALIFEIGIQWCLGNDANVQNPVPLKYATRMAKTAVSKPGHAEAERDFRCSSAPNN